ncbi:hypothetical protein BJX76DRAFT_296793 [Aspergillus varians]
MLPRPHGRKSNKQGSVFLGVRIDKKVTITTDFTLQSTRRKGSFPPLFLLSTPHSALAGYLRMLLASLPIESSVLL